MDWNIRKVFPTLELPKLNWCYWRETYSVKTTKTVWFSLPQLKGTDSIILMAAVGPKYEFLFADVEMNGRNSDGDN